MRAMHAVARNDGKFAIASQLGIGNIATSSHSQTRVILMRHIAWAAALVRLTAAFPAFADDPSFPIADQGHQFVPSRLNIPAGVKVKLIVSNENPTPSEFESSQFHREEVVVTAGQEITVFVGPLDPGSYEFFDDFHPQTRGHLIVK